ncbi:MAG: HAD family hydrolase [Bacteroidales bacterium]|nr:HAD family hydrolase [Bacteroidales bacterium]
MRKDSKKYIRNLLDNLDPLIPIPTGVKPRFKRDENIKGVVFDIYGTLLVSSSGDVDQAEISDKNLERALHASGIKIVDGDRETLDYILNDFNSTIKVCHDAGRMNNLPYPEIDILSIWRIVLIHAKRKGLIAIEKDADIALMTCVFEFLSNKVSIMPGLKETISSLRARRIPLGIVSNAQFYTPVLMNYFLHNKISLKERIKGFDKELTVFSYKFGKGKPDQTLFNELIPTLKWKYGIIPSEVLFIGNDMLKDIYASNRVGFKTVLFAGDKRSLRIHENDIRTKSLKPDYVITHLEQILKIV